MRDIKYCNVLCSCCRITYCPRSVGVYSIHVLDKDQNIAGKPIKVDVFDPGMIKLSKISDVILGQDNRIRVDTSGAGEGALSVTIRAAGQEVRHTIQDMANGQYEIVFYPTMAIPHKFDVKYKSVRNQGFICLGINTYLLH